jgi:hypothetical protein
MALRNLHGYWKYSDAVVPFRIQPVQLEQVAHAFIRRTVRSVVERTELHTDTPVRLEEPVQLELPAPEIASPEITSDKQTDLDFKF